MSNRGNPIIEYCMNRVVRLFHNAKSAYKVFFQEENGNILFLTMYLDMLQQSTTHVEKIIDVANRETPQAQFVLSRIEEKRVMEEIPYNEWNTQLFESFVCKKDWASATSLMTLGWIHCNLVNQQKMEEIIVAGVNAFNDIVEDNSRHATKMIITKTGKFAGMLKPDWEHLIYFLTHVLFIATQWGNDKINLKKYTIKRVECLKLFQQWLNQFSEQQLHLNLEIALELAICVNILSSSQISKIQCIESMFERTSIPTPDSEHGYMLFPNNNQTNIYGKKYYWHCDYHLHILIAFYFVQQQHKYKHNLLVPTDNLGK